MGALRGRVRRIEARLGAASVCPVCAGRGRLALVLEGEPLPAGCHRCGRVGACIMVTIANRPPGIDDPPGRPSMTVPT